MKELFKFGGDIGKKTNIIVSIIGGILILCIWYLITIPGHSLISSQILPNPINVIKSIPDILSGNLFYNMFYTIGLNWLGYFYAILVAIPIGYLIGIFPIFRSMFRNIFEAIRYMPLPTVSGIFIASYGLGFDMKAKFLAFGIMLFLIPCVIQRVLDLQNSKNEKEFVYIQTAKTMGMTNWQMFRYIYWPHIMEGVYGDIRQLVAISYTYVVIAECLNKEGGLGAMISTLTRQSRIADVYMLILIIIGIGILQDWIIKTCSPLIFKHQKQ